MPPRNLPAYEADFVAWLEDQAGRSRRAREASLDLDSFLEGAGNGRTSSRLKKVPGDACAG